MPMEFPELPTWVFQLDEVSAGVYRVRARDSLGRSVEAKGVDPDALIEDARKTAKGMMNDVPSRLSKPGSGEPKWSDERDRPPHSHTPS